LKTCILSALIVSSAVCVVSFPGFASNAAQIQSDKILVESNNLTNNSVTSSQLFQSSEFFPNALTEPSRTTVSGTRFSQFYTNQNNYDAVYRNVMSWFGTTRNACVAFASTALRMLGLNVPQDGILNGERLSLLTKPFSIYMEAKLGWIRIRDSRALKPGDLVFTIDEPGYPGYPSHVFMHAGYADSARTISWAVDNQDFTHERALQGDPAMDYDAFAYALRSPVH